METGWTLDGGVEAEGRRVGVREGGGRVEGLGSGGVHYFSNTRFKQRFYTTSVARGLAALH